MADRPDNRPGEEKPRKPGTFPPGVSGNPGGRPKALKEIERMLDEEHRNLENMRMVFDRLRTLATEDHVKVFMSKKGEPVESIETPDPAFMKLYLERVMGPVKDLDIDLSDASEETIRYLAEHGVRTN
jgi:hypothetical protein